MRSSIQYVAAAFVLQLQVFGSAASLCAAQQQRCGAAAAAVAQIAAVFVSAIPDFGASIRRCLIWTVV